MDNEKKEETNINMKKIKHVLNHIFIDGLGGMALGLFSTLIIGTILAQIGTYVGGSIGSYIIAIANIAKTLTGAGIGVGVAVKYKTGPIVTVSAAVAGLYLESRENLSVHLLLHCLQLNLVHWYRVRLKLIL